MHLEPNSTLAHALAETIAGRLVRADHDAPTLAHLAAMEGFETGIAVAAGFLAEAAEALQCDRLHNAANQIRGLPASVV